MRLSLMRILIRKRATLPYSIFLIIMIIGAQAVHVFGQESSHENKCLPSSKSDQNLLKKNTIQPKESMFLKAAADNCVDMVEELLVENINVDTKDEYAQTALMLTRNVHIATELIERGADVNAKANYGRTPLMDAVWNGH